MHKEYTYEELANRVEDLEKENEQLRQADRESELSKDIYASVLQNLAFGISNVDREGRITFSNPTFANMLGYEPEELLGKKGTDIVYPGQEHILPEAVAGRPHGVSSSYEIDYLHKNGTPVSFLVSGRAVFEKDIYAGSVAVFTDITARKKAEKIQSVLYNISRAVTSTGRIEELFESIQKSLMEVIDTKNFSIAFYDNETDTLTFPYRRDEMSEMLSPVHNASKSGIITVRVLETGKAFFIKKEEIKEIYATCNVPIPEVIPESWLGTPLKIDNTIIGVVYIKNYYDPYCYNGKDVELMESISDHIAMAIQRKRSEESLLESEEKLRAIFETSPDAILLATHDGTILRANPAACAMFERPEMELRELSRDNIIDTGDPNYTLFLEELARMGYFRGEIYHKKKDGTRFPCEITVSLFKDREGNDRSSIIIRDISERKKAEEEIRNAYQTLEQRVRKQTFDLEKANIKLQEEILEREKAEEILRKSEEKFSKAFHNSPVIKAIATVKEGRFIDVNDKFLKTYGYNREEVIGRTSIELNMIPSHEGRRRMVRNIEETGLIKGHEGVFFTKTGEKIIGDIHSERIFIENEPCILSAVVDITEKKRAEKALQESEERYRNLFEKAPAGISLATKNGKIITCNQTMADLLGYPVDDLKRISLADIYEHAETRENILKQIEQTGMVSNFPVRLRTKSGDIRDALLSMSKVYSDNQELLQTIGIDITEQTRIEKEKERLEGHLQHSRRLGAIASLAGGIAHRFNNALSVIVGNLDLLMMDQSYNKNLLRYVEPIKISASRMSYLTDQLLAYARGGKYQPVETRIKDFIHNTLPLLEHNIQPSVHIETDLPTNLMGIEVDQTQIQMLISAIISNASDAMVGEGRIRISCRNENITGADPHDPAGLKPGAYVRMTFEDEGRGMDTESMERLFEPFYSTKVQGRGLSMAAVYGIVQNHNGHITVESEKGRGTKIHVYLPAIDKNDQ